MVAEPTERPVTRPEAKTFATVVSVLLQTPVTDVSCSVSGVLKHIVGIPVITPVSGRGFTVIMEVSNACLLYTSDAADE